MTSSSASVTVQDRARLLTEDQWPPFLAALTHELRTPLASLRMLAELLVEAPSSRLGNQEKRYVENIQEVIQDLLALVGDLSDLAHLLADRVDIRVKEVVLEDLMDQVKDSVRPRVWERGVIITDSLDSSLPRRVRSDPDRLRQALVLLLGAAASHADSEVFVRLEAEGGTLRVTVSSNGSAFADGALPHLFEPFDPGAGAARQRGGRSLALPLAKELAQVLGGTLSAENRKGRPTFELTLPTGGP